MNVQLWLERFAEHLEMRNLSERTRESYRLEARAFLHFLTDRAVDQPAAITRHEVEAYRVHLMRSRKPDGMPLTPATQSAKITGVQAFLRFLHQGHFVLVNPGRDLPRPPRRCPASCSTKSRCCGCSSSPTPPGRWGCATGPSSRCSTRAPSATPRCAC